LVELLHELNFVYLVVFYKLKHGDMCTRSAFALLFLLIGLTACKKEVEANFQSNSNTVTQGNTLTFTDLTSGEPTSWEWTFEGGTPATSTDQNPTITYNEVGTFAVTLKVTNKKKESTKTIPGAVTVNSFVNYTDQFFPTFIKTENVNYGINPTEHLMNIYEPEGDDRAQRPFVFIFGGGAFEGSNLVQLEPMAAELTKIWNCCRCSKISLRSK
jgi:PKD repeat protein